MEKPECFNLEIHSDDRGYLVPLTNELSEKIGKPVKRTYIVGNFGRGVVRGLHFHEKEIKIFYIAKGSAKFVAINPENPEDKHIFVTSDRNPQLVIIPPGYANGWMSLEDGTILVSLSTSTFEESVNDDKRYDPLKWGDFWTLKSR